MPTRPAEASLSRRDLLKIAGAALVLPQGAALAAPPPLLTPTHAGAQSMMGVPFEAKDTVRVAIVGTGLRGSSVLREFLAVDNVRITALCDIVPEKVTRAARRVTDAGQPAPAMFTAGDHDFENLVKRDDIDFVYTATPWPWHTPVALAAMNAGKHVGTEVPVGDVARAVLGPR